MKERILEFLKRENKSSAQFAEEIGVQPSGISHILSGRNNPSLDFILKMLEKYKYISTDWLLFGKGDMYKEAEMRNLFELSSEPPQKIQSEAVQVVENNSKVADNQLLKVKEDTMDETEIEKVIWFYKNNSFREFYPSK